MLLTLLKKQWQQRISALFRTRGKGSRSKGMAVFLGILIVFGYLCLAFSVFAMGMMLAVPFAEMGLGWLYFAIFGLAALCAGIMGDVFTAYGALYRAKDNDTLLALPIPPRTLLTARMAQVMGMAFLWTGLIWLPSCLCYWITVRPGGGAVLAGLLLWVALALTVTVLCCFLGWLVALIAGRLRNRNFWTVVLSLTFFFLYYFFFARIDAVFEEILLKAAELAEGIRGYAWPVYQLGLGATGELLPFLTFMGLALLLFGLCLFILSKTFIRIVTSERGAKKNVYKARRASQQSTDRALLRKELGRFVSSPVYLMNCGIGLIMLVGISVAAVVKRDLFAEVSAVLPDSAPDGIMLLLAALVQGMLLLTNAPAAASVSLEGRWLWIVKSLPVSSAQVLRAKRMLQFLLSGAAILVSVPLLSVALSFTLPEALALAAFELALVFFLSGFALQMNLLKPDLDWVSETVPVKQDMPVALSLFGGWLFTALLLLPALLLLSVAPVWICLTVSAALALGAGLLESRWLARRGAARFDEL